MTMRIEQLTDAGQKARIAEAVLLALPDLRAVYRRLKCRRNRSPVTV